MSIYLNCPPWWCRWVCTLSAAGWPSSLESTVYTWCGTCAWSSQWPRDPGAAYLRHPHPAAAVPWPVTGSPAAPATLHCSPGTPAGPHSLPALEASTHTCAWLSPGPGLKRGGSFLIRMKLNFKHLTRPVMITIDNYITLLLEDILSKK